VILGADAFLEDGLPHPHWQMLRYRSLAVAEYLQRLDFMVYFTSPLWRESFGRVIAEAIAAGKVVITDPQTAVPFGRGAIGAQPAEVDQIIARLIEAPARYRGHVRAGQARLQEWSAYRFARMFARAALPGTGA
jgi:glycosyltransferase involved in cell wall biosynthesis